MIRSAVLVLLLLAFLGRIEAQVCTNAGQTPSSAILLCGSGSYTVNQVPLCGQLTVPTPCPQTSPYQNNNPIWFRLDCFRSGTLGFSIVPVSHTDNYDWQLFDVTGRNDDDVMSDGSLFLACNWCPDAGETGASQDGTRLQVCTESTQELFTAMPDLIVGHEYLLLVSHRNANESGFEITITSGTASVTDPVEPRLFSARLACNSNQIDVYFNKEMECNSLAADGSDFTLDGPASITGAIFSCTGGRTGMVSLTLSNPLPPGNYRIGVRPGTDGSGVLDRCTRDIPADNYVPVQMPVAGIAVMDSLTRPGCAPKQLQLVFRKPVQCNSVALDGSDFRILGPQGTVIQSVEINCNTTSLTTTTIILHLADPILTGGNYALSLVNGRDGNTLVDECGAILATATLSFDVVPAVAADFSYTIRASCRLDTLLFTHLYPTGVNQWNWQFDGQAGPSQPTIEKIYPASGDHIVKLMVSNGLCSDTASAGIRLNNRVTAAFDLPPVICPEDGLRLVNQTSGDVNFWQWNIGGATHSIIQHPPDFHFPAAGREAVYTIQLVAENSLMNCRDSLTKQVHVLGSCFIAVPTAFTPNGDGLNDFLHPNNALKAEGLIFLVYNRLGQLVFESRDWTRRWDGRVNGQPQPAGVYPWILRYSNRETGEKIFQKGTTVLIR